MKVVDRTDNRGQFVAAAREALTRGSAVRLSIDDHEVTIDGTIAQAVLAVVDQATDGASIVVTTQAAELTTGQAADLLGVSRPTVVSLVDSGKLPARRIGTHRRIQTADVLAYRDQRRSERGTGMDELVILSEELGLYEDD